MLPKAEVKRQLMSACGANQRPISKMAVKTLASVVNDMMENVFDVLETTMPKKKESWCRVTPNDLFRAVSKVPEFKVALGRSQLASLKATLDNMEEDFKGGVEAFKKHLKEVKDTEGRDLIKEERNRVKRERRKRVAEKKKKKEEEAAAAAAAAAKKKKKQKKVPAVAPKKAKK